MATFETTVCQPAINGSQYSVANDSSYLIDPIERDQMSQKEEEPSDPDAKFHELSAAPLERIPAYMMDRLDWIMSNDMLEGISPEICVPKKSCQRHYDALPTSTLSKIPPLTTKKRRSSARGKPKVLATSDPILFEFDTATKAQTNLKVCIPSWAPSPGTKIDMVKEKPWPKAVPPDVQTLPSDLSGHIDLFQKFETTRVKIPHHELEDATAQEPKGPKHLSLDSFSDQASKDGPSINDEIGLGKETASQRSISAALEQPPFPLLERSANQNFKEIMAAQRAVEKPRQKQVTKRKRIPKNYVPTARGMSNSSCVNTEGEKKPDVLHFDQSGSSQPLSAIQAENTERVSTSNDGRKPQATSQETVHDFVGNRSGNALINNPTGTPHVAFGGRAEVGKEKRPECKRDIDVKPSGSASNIVQISLDKEGAIGAPDQGENSESSRGQLPVSYSRGRGRVSPNIKKPRDLPMRTKHVTVEKPPEQASADTSMVDSSEIEADHMVGQESNPHARATTRKEKGWYLDNGQKVSKSKWVRVKRARGYAEKANDLVGHDLLDQLGGDVYPEKLPSRSVAPFNTDDCPFSSVEAAQELSHTPTQFQQQQLQRVMSAKVWGRGPRGMLKISLSSAVMSGPNTLLMSFLGRFGGRTASSQISGNDAAMAFQQYAQSPGRRQRGFQPSEVNNAKLSFRDDKDLDKIQAPIEVQNSIRSHMSIDLQPSNCPTSKASISATLSSTGLIGTQVATMDASRPELDPVEIGHPSQTDEAGKSSVEIITKSDQRSCWSRTVSSETPRLDWRNNIATASRSPQTAAPAPKQPQVADLSKIPKHFFQRASKKAENSVNGISSNKCHAASVEKQKEQQVEDYSYRTQAPLPYEPTVGIASQLGPSIIQRPENGSYSMQGPSLGVPSRDETQFPPHLRVYTRGQTTNASRPEHVLFPQLEAAVASHSDNNEDIAAGKRTIEAMKNYEVPSHLAGRSVHRSPASHAKSTVEPSYLEVEHDQPPMIDNNKSTAVAQKPVVDMDEEIAAAVSAETSGENVIQLSSSNQTGSKVVPPHLKNRPHRPFSMQGQSKPSNMWKQTPVTEDSNLAANGDASQAHATPSKSDDILNIPPKTKAHRSDNAHKSPRPSHPIFTSSKKGKAPESQGLEVDFKGDIIAPPVGSDWAQRTQFNSVSEERLSVINAWREDQAADVEFNQVDLNLSNQNMLNTVAEEDHETIPNKDKFTQARRGQNAADAIKVFQARMAAHGKSKQSDIPEMTREEKREYRRLLLEEERNRILPPSPHAPIANIYLRPAEHKDMLQISELYNYYVSETSAIPELDPTTELDWRDILQEAQDGNNPFIVAVHMGGKPPRDHRNTVRRKQETIIGFAYAWDVGRKRTIYRYTVELEIVVKFGHTRLGVGRTLLDRLLAALDPGYNLLECAPFLTDENQSFWIGGGKRVVKTILVNLLYPQSNEEHLDWQKKWLAKSYFEFVGTVPRVGYKFGKP